MEKKKTGPGREKEVGKRVEPSFQAKSQAKYERQKMTRARPSPNQLSKQEKGQLGEAVAAAYFQNQGFKLLARNYHSRRGEVDLICAKGRVLVFVEVKARSSFRWGQPQDWVTPSKQSRIFYTARAFLRDPSTQLELDHYFSYQGPSYLRFDILEVDLSKKKLRHLPNAFQPGGGV